MVRDFYKNVDEFIEDAKKCNTEAEIEELARYDFKNQAKEMIIELEGDDLKKIKDEEERKKKQEDNKTKIENYTKIINAKNPIEKLLLYKGKFDCDCLDLTNGIYEKLWGCKLISKGTPRYSLGKLGEKLANTEYKTLERDTINSFKRTYSRAIILESMAKNIKLNDYYMGYGNYRMSKVLKDENVKKHKIKEKVEENPYIKDFAILTHSIGNFTMLINPNKNEYKMGFNMGRNKSVMDYWDLSLELLKNELTKKGQLEVFKAYVETFDLIDCEGKSLYVRKDADGEYKINALCKNHLNEKDEIWYKNKLPKNMDELNEFVKNVNEKILERGKIMIKQLRNT